MASEYRIQRQFNSEWNRGRELVQPLLRLTRRQVGVAYMPVHGDPLLSQLADGDLVCYFIYTLSSWWEAPLIDRINADRPDNNFAILMDINPTPETVYRLLNDKRRSPENRYKSGLLEIFPHLDSDVADAMYNLLRNGFSHNLFGREPRRILFDNDFECPPILDERNTLLVPPIQLALSMVTFFVEVIPELLLFRVGDRARIFKSYMTGSA